MVLELLRIDPWNGNLITGITYYGYATPGTQDSNSIWTIKRKVVNNGILKYEYPYILGSSNEKIFNFSGLVWNNRNTYTYSENSGGLISAGIWDDNKLWLDTDTWLD